MVSSSLCMKPGASGMIVEPGRICHLWSINRRADSAPIWNPRQCGSLPSWCPWSFFFFFSSWPLGFPTLRTREFALLPVRSKSNKSLLAGNQRVAALPVPDALLATALCTQGCAQVQVEEGGGKVYWVLWPASPGTNLHWTLHIFSQVVITQRAAGANSTTSQWLLIGIIMCYLWERGPWGYSGLLDNIPDFKREINNCIYVFDGEMP